MICCGFVFLFSAIEFYMPPICSPIVRPGRPAEVAPVIAKQLSDVILRYVDAMLNLSLPSECEDLSWYFFFL